jgi:hypothetical protein
MKTNLQNKWRLPTIEEFENVLHPNKHKIPKLNNSDYWSSSEYSDYAAWSFFFFIGEASYANKDATKRVRAVRDVLSNSTNLSNSTIIGNLEVFNKDFGRMNWYDAVDAVNKLNHNKKH